MMYLLIIYFIFTSFLAGVYYRGAKDKHTYFILFVLVIMIILIFPLLLSWYIIEQTYYKIKEGKMK